MIDALAYAVVALAGIAVVWGLVSAIANKPPGKAQLLYAAGLEVVTVIQSIIAAVQMIGGFRPAELATTIGYLIGIVILIPIALALGQCRTNSVLRDRAGRGSPRGARHDAAFAGALDACRMTGRCS